LLENGVKNDRTLINLNLGRRVLRLNSTFFVSFIGSLSLLSFHIIIAFYYSFAVYLEKF